MKSKVVGSMITSAPSFWNTLHQMIKAVPYTSFSSRELTILKLYWKPEQPPLSTYILRYRLEGSLAWSCRTLRTVLSVIVMEKPPSIVGGNSEGY